MKLTAQKNGKWNGAPDGTGTTKDGFILRADGCAFTNSGESFTSAQVAGLAGITSDEYEPCVEFAARNGHAPNGHHSAPQALAAPKAPQTPEQRGITPDTLKAFGVERVRGDKPNRDGWKYPTHHADGKQGRARFKNARAKIGDELKYQWWRGGDDRQPDAYNLNRIPDAARDVWAVGGEPDVWAMVQNGFDVVSTFGETQGAAKLVAAIKAKRVQVLHIALDNDDAGKKGAAEIARECQKQGQSFTLRRFDGAAGFDVCDQFARADFDRETFYAAMLELPEIEAILPDATPEPNTIETARNPFQLIQLKTIFARPRALWLVRGLLLENGYSAITGDYGTFKSFVALDMALCIASGRVWQGREVKQGTVVYVVAEGAYTTADRVKAWCIRHQVEAPEDFYLIEIPAQIGDASTCAQFIEAIKAVAPVFVILDTLAKCNVGADENSTRDMGLFTHGMQTVANELGAQVLTIHHNNKNGTARGSVSLPCNVDTHITIKASAGRIVTIECEKQKGAPFDAFSLIGRIVELGARDEYDDEITSLVFEPTDAPPVEARDGADGTREKVLQVLAGMPKGGRATVWQLECARLKIAGRSRFYDFRDELVESSKVIKTNDIYTVASPISPISPIRTESEPKKKSDSSDDVHTSDESDYMAGLGANKAKSERKPKNANAESEAYAPAIQSDDETEKF